jgi:hypothetical protein
MEESAASETASSEGYGPALTTEEEEQLLVLLSRLMVEEKERILLHDSQITGYEIFAFRRFRVKIKLNIFFI